jgi:adenosylcobinamide kinase/adenosylcobinamide-phosphate guanylyltransferase
MSAADRGRSFLVVGGSGSGKSEFAQTLARRLGEPVTYLATARAEGPEMAWRIRRHQQSRPASWTTVEAPRGLARALDAAGNHGPVVLLEDVGSLAAACLPRVEEHDGELALPHVAVEEAQAALEGELDAVYDWCAARGKALVVVSLEVGLGMLPPSPLGRLYKDVVGEANQRLAARADRTYLVVAGLPIEIGALARETLAGLGIPHPPAPREWAVGDGQWAGAPHPPSPSPSRGEGE